MKVKWKKDNTEYIKVMNHNHIYKNTLGSYVNLFKNTLNKHSFIILVHFSLYFCICIVLYYSWISLNACAHKCIAPGVCEGQSRL